MPNNSTPFLLSSLRLRFYNLLRWRKRTNIAIFNFWRLLNYAINSLWQLHDRLRQSLYSDCYKYIHKYSETLCDKIKNSFPQRHSHEVQNVQFTRRQGIFIFCWQTTCGKILYTSSILRKVKSYFRFIFLDQVGKNGVVVHKKLFPLQKNGLLNKWSQVDPDFGHYNMGVQ